MMKKVAIFMLSMLVTMMSYSVQAGHHYAGYEKQQFNSQKTAKRSKQKAMQIAEQKTGGKAVAVKLNGDGKTYRVRVLLSNGTVKHVLVSAFD